MELENELQEALAQSKALNAQVAQEYKERITEGKLTNLLTITPIDRDPRKCRKHFDVWHLMKTDGKDFNVDMSEYHEIEWLSILKARQITTDAANQAALDFLVETGF